MSGKKKGKIIRQGFICPVFAKRNDVKNIDSEREAAGKAWLDRHPVKDRISEEMSVKYRTQA